MNCAALKLHLGALIRTQSERALWEDGKRIAILKTLHDQGLEIRSDEWPEHPHHHAAISGIVKQIEAWAADETKPRTVCVSFTDSICAIPGEAITAIDIHAGISGSGGHNTLQMARAILPIIHAHGLVVDTVITGCDIGNMLLQRWDYEKAISDTRENHVGIRQLVPDALILRYGLPPVWDLYTTAHRWRSEIDLHRICVEDGNSIYVSLWKLGSFFGLIPTSRRSVEGVHLSDRGVIKLDRLFWRGRRLRIHGLALA